MARFVDPETAGRFRLFTIPLMYMTFLHLGTFDGLGRQIPLHVGRGDRVRAEAIASTAGAWNLWVSVVVSAGFALLALGALIRGEFPSALGWLTQSVMAWGVFYGGYLAATYRTISHFLAMARIQLLATALSFGLVFTLPLLQFVGLCVRSAVPSAVSTLLLHRLRPIRVQLRYERDAFREVIRVGLPFCLWGSLHTSIWTAIESTLIFYLGGAQALGHFAVAVVFREGVCIVPQAITQVITPRMVQLYGRDGHLRSAAPVVRRVVAVLVVAMVFLVFGLSMLLEAVVPRFLPRYEEGLPLITACLWLGVIQAAALPLNGLIAHGRAWGVGRGIAAGLFTFMLSSWLLLPHTGGVLAVAWASLVGRVIRTAVGSWDLAVLERKTVP